MPKVFTSESQKKGELGEDIACRYLACKGYSILERNYTRRCGEIDIVARKGKKLHFVEVKACIKGSSMRPLDNMHPVKMAKLRSVILVYLSQRRSMEWQFDIVLVDMDMTSKLARVRMLEHVTL